LRFDSLV